MNYEPGKFLEQLKSLERREVIVDRVGGGICVALSFVLAALMVWRG